LSMSQSQGQGDMQLPDIIMSQEELNKMMEEGMKQSESQQSKEGEGHKGKEGEKDGKEKGQNKEGQDGNNSGGRGEGFNNDLDGKLFEIYQQQQQLREALEKQLDKEGLGGAGQRLLREMEQVEM